MADDVAHLIAMLGRGDSFREFVTQDVEGEVYAQTPGAQLLCIACKGAPAVETFVLQYRSENAAVLTGIIVTFALTLRIKMADGVLWEVDVDHGYEAKNVHLTDGQRSLTQKFSVINGRQVSEAY